MASQSPKSNSALKELTINDLALLCNTLNPVASKCFELGLQLGVEYSQLCTIDRDYRKSKDQLSGIISERLKQDSPLTWHDIVTALQSPSVNHPDLARHIESQYISPCLDLQQHPLLDPQQDNVESSHMTYTHTSTHHSMQVSAQHSSNPTAQIHAQVILPPSATDYALHSPFPKQYLPQPLQPVNTGMYTPFPSRPSLQSYLHCNQTLLQPHIPPQHTSRYPLSTNPFLQQPHCLPPQPLHIPSSSIHQSVSSSDQSSSRSTSAVVASQSSLQCTQPGSLYPSSIVPSHTIQPPSTQTSWGTPYRYPLMYPMALPAHPNMPCIPQPYHTTPHTLPPTTCTRLLQEGVEGGQWDSKLYMSHSQPQTSHTQSQKNSSMEPCPPTRSPCLQSNPELSQREGSNASHSTKRIDLKSPYSTSVATASTSDTPPLKCTSYIDVVNQHSDVLTETISGDLTFFINKFIELGFVTRTATDDILSQHGVGNREKARQLLSLLTVHYNRKLNKKIWFLKFVSVFSCEAAYEDLVDRMTTQMQTSLNQSKNFQQSGLGSLPAETISPMDQYIDYVKDTYRQSVIERDLNVLKWPQTPSQFFINLAYIDMRTIVRKEEADEYTRAMIEDGNIDVILNKKTEIEFSDIARGLPVTNSSERVILVEGAPGVGKSTFAWEFCRRWERGEIAQQYQLVLLLRLRDERMSRAKTLQDLLYHPVTEEDTSHAIRHELDRGRGVNTLIILEGFDELPHSQRKECSIFLQLILGKLLLHATIMITSRPWATGEIMRRIEHRVFQHIEILGFTEENVEKYVKSVFTGEDKKTASAMDQNVGGPDEVRGEAKKNIDDIMVYLHTYPQIKACMYIPLNAAIVVSIYQESKKEKCILPKTLTELYYALTQVLLLRYLYGHPHYGEQEWNIACLEKDLPSKVFKQLLTICKVAYDGICTQGKGRVQLIFSDDDLKKLGVRETLGFMQSVAEVYVKHGQRMSHNFLHLTVQEFLAAFLIYIMSPVEQLKYFQRHKDGRLRVVLRFVAGLTKLNRVNHDQLRGLLGEPSVENSERYIQHCNPMRPDVCVSAHHTNWLFEAQNSELVQSLFHNITASFTFTTEMVPLEYYSVGYCIAHSHSNWSLTFDGDTEKEKLHMLVNGAITDDGDYRVALRDSSMTPGNMHILVNGFSSHVEELYFTDDLSLPPLPTLRILQINMGNHYNSVFNISCDFSFSSLEVLIIRSSVSDTTLGTKTCEAIGKLLSSTTSLKKFQFSANVDYNRCPSYKMLQFHVSDKDMEVITKGLSDNIALPLKNLYIDCQCTFTTTATRSLVQFITRSTTLQYLKIRIDTFEDVDIFAKGLSDNIALPLKSLDINCTCTFTTTATSSLVQFITRSTTLQYLNIHIDTFEDVDIFAKGLSGNIALPLKSLDIDCKCTFTTTATRSLVQFITRTTTLQYIRICHATFSAQGLIELTEAIHNCSRLQEKKLEQLLFLMERSEDVVNLRHMIKDYPDMPKCINWKRIIITYLSSIEVNELTVPTLNLALDHKHDDHYLFLTNNSISDAGAVALAQALHHNSTLKWLNLSNNSIGDAGVVALAQALHHNSTLKKLNLSGNDAIGKEGTHQLVQALTMNTSITTKYGGGLLLSWRCVEYATQCPQYNTVKDRIIFW